MAVQGEHIQGPMHGPRRENTNGVQGAKWRDSTNHEVQWDDLVKKNAHKGVQKW